MERLRGTVVAVERDQATVALEDGSERSVPVPEMIQVEVGMTVRIADFGDGKPLYAWGT